MTKFSENRSGHRLPGKDIVVMYHGNCTDGFCAAWAAWKKFGDAAEYIAMNLGIAPPQGLVGKEIYTVDFTFLPEYMEKLLTENTRVVSIDHHRTAEEAVQLTTDHVFDLNHSGAVLSWNYFHPGEKLPEMLRYVEDFDLWKFHFPETKKLIAYLDLFDFNFEVWDAMIRDFEDHTKLEAILPQAELLLRYEQVLIQRIVNNRSELVEFEGHRTYVVNSPVFGSDIGKLLYEKLPPMAIVWYRDKDRLKFSLRSDGSVDVSILAQKFGGGGHKGSAGFKLPIGSEFPWKKINEDESND